MQISMNQMAIGFAIGVIIVLFIKLFWRRRQIQAMLMSLSRRQYAASLQYIGDRAVDAETLKDIRTRVVQIIFPPGVTVQSSNDENSSSEKPSVPPIVDPESNTQQQDTTVENVDEIVATDGDETNNKGGDEKPGSTSIKNACSDENSSGSNDTDPPAIGSADVASTQQQPDYYDPESNTVEQADVVLLDDSERDYVRECSICLGEYKVGDETATNSRCSHVFHRECILEWSTLRKECPICRTEMWEPEQFERLQKDIADQVIPTEEDGVIR